MGNIVKDPDYYLPPPQWRYDSIVSLYKSLTSNKIISEVDFDQFDHGSEVIRVKSLLQFISERIKLNDSAAIAISVNFVVSPVYFHYSGYIRQTMARRLRKVELSEYQVNQVINGVEDLIRNDKTGRGFEQIYKLYISVNSPI